MKTYRIAFVRPAAITLRGFVEVEAENMDAAHRAAEDMLMQGSVEMTPDIDSIELSRRHAAVIETTTETNS
jgi:hypothetical protein